MGIPEHENTVEQCDVPEARRAALNEYRIFRRECLERISGAADTSIANQIHDLTWHTAVFRTLNEARRIEPRRSVNGALWELTTAGYATLMTLGIRKLVDRDRRANSVWNAITFVQQHNELLTRENFICSNGLPYDYEAVRGEDYASIDFKSGGTVRWLPTRGPKAWTTSELMHKAFDKFCGNPARRERTDRVEPSILITLKDHLAHPAIKKVCAFTNKRIAHADHTSERAEAVPVATYNDIDDALQQIIRVTDCLSGLFFDGLGSVVATPQFNVLEGLDRPWVTQRNLSALRRYWDELCGSMDAWTSSAGDELLQ